MKIFIITHYYPPETGAPQARLSELAKAWMGAGHNVTVLTGFPNRPRGVIPQAYRRRWFLEELEDGVRVWRHWLYATPNQGVFRQSMGHLSFAVTVVMTSLLRGEAPDVVVVSSPTLLSAGSAWCFSLCRSVPFVLEVRDLWPGIFVELGILKNRFLIRLLEGLELFLYRRAARVVPVTEGIRVNMESRGIPGHKLKVITGGVDTRIFKPTKPLPEAREQFGLTPEHFVVLYAGAHGVSQGLQTVVEAALALRRKVPEIRFLMVGDGAEKEKLVRKAADYQLDNILFFPSVLREQMVELYNLADLCLVPQCAIEGFKTVIPSKMFEIMACGRPLLACLHGEAAMILEQSGAARIIPPEDPFALANQVLALKNSPEILRTMGASGRRFVQHTYSREKLARDYLRLLQDVVLDKDRRPAMVKENGNK